MTYIIAIANEKGGVAKTTSTISIGAAMVESGLEVLLVDVDPQANLSLALGIENGKEQTGLANLLLDSAAVQSAVHETGIPKLSVVAPGESLGLAERYLHTQQGYESVMAKLFREGDWPYDYILFDCPPFLGSLTLNAITASDLLIMPTQPEFFSINALRNMMATVRKVRSQGNPRLIYRLLLTMFDRRNRIHRTLNEQLRSTFGNGVFSAMIETDTKLRESPIVGLPIIYHAPKSRSALQYRALTEEILAYVKETNSQPA